MKFENSTIFDESIILIVEVPGSEHKIPEIIEAKKKELENLKHYGTLE